MSDLVEFLKARLDKDEQVAQEAARLQDDPENGWGVLPHESYSISEKRRWIEPHVGMLNEAESASHVARHDPARVLREVEAKRRLIDQLLKEGDYLYEDEFRLLALPYADHPDYDESWRP